MKRAVLPFLATFDDPTLVRDWGWDGRCGRRGGRCRGLVVASINTDTDVVVKKQRPAIGSDTGVPLVADMALASESPPALTCTAVPMPGEGECQLTSHRG
jgi:hypothetical protein